MACGGGRLSFEVENYEAGYECNFVSEVPDSLQCLICMNPARNAHQVSCCGRVFCKYCLDNLVGRECPNCRSRERNVFKDKRGERDILSFQVKCTHCDHGCSWVGELRQFDDHVARCSKNVISCPYSSAGCKAKILKDHLEDHKAASTVEHLELAMERIKVLEDSLKTKTDIKNLSPVIFKMENFDMFEESGLDWDSPPFYTHNKGYKLYLKVKAVRNDYFDITSSISVLVCLMHGEYDDDLIWPFRGTINFELLDQTSDCVHKEGTARFMERHSSKKNRKVSAEEGKRSIGWGVDDILTHDDDDDDDTEWFDYIANDTLYIKITDVTLSEANKPWLIQ